MIIRKAVIPAAGFGTRFLPITKVVPKELLPIGNKPSIQYVVEEAVASGIEEIILVTHPSKTKVIDYFQPDEDLKKFLKEKRKQKELQELEKIESMARFQVVTQEKPLGLGHAIGCARDAVGEEPFVVLLPDVVVMSEVPATQQLMDACGDDWGILLERVPKERVSSYGIIRGKEIETGVYQLQETIEKPSPDKAPSDLAILGRYLFPPEVFSLIDQTKPAALGEIQLTDAINALCQKRPGRGVVCHGRIFDVGTPEGLLQAMNCYSQTQ